MSETTFGVIMNANMKGFPPHVQELIRRCRDEKHLDPRNVLEAIADPEWEDAGKVHDWRNHVFGTIQELWDHLSLDARLAIYLTASILAGLEDWD